LRSRLNTLILARQPCSVFERRDLMEFAATCSTYPRVLTGLYRFIHGTHCWAAFPLAKRSLIVIRLLQVIFLSPVLYRTAILLPMPAVSSGLNSSPEFPQEFHPFPCQGFLPLNSLTPFTVLVFVPMGDIFIRPSGVPRS